MTRPDFVRLTEVGPRDGLQNETRQVTTAEKIMLIDRLSETGFKSIETGSFVSPEWVPQMADSGAVLQGITRTEGVRYAVLTPNMEGLDAALAAGAGEIAVFGAASESFSQKNINAGIEESLARFEPLCTRALSQGLPVRAYISCVLDCPYEGAIEPCAVAEMAAVFRDMGCYEISLGDTIGTGTPFRVQRLIETVAAQTGVQMLAGHFHDTYGQALANIYAALETGMAGFDCAVAGLGGCPYARGATGNVASEDLVYMLDGCGIETGIDFNRLLDVSVYVSEILGRRPVSRVARALGA